MKSNRLLAPILVQLALPAMFLLGASLQADASEKAPAEAKPVVVNRAILTVGREIFTAADAAAMLMIWNMTKAQGESSVPLVTDWLKPIALGQTAGLDPFLVMKSWPADLRTFFHIALISIDVQKLNLFMLREAEIMAQLKSFTQQGEALTQGLKPELAKEVLGATDVAKKKWIESVVRVRSFIRVRGPLERNKNLLSVGWYWHNTPLERVTRQ